MLRYFCIYVEGVDTSRVMLENFSSKINLVAVVLKLQTFSANKYFSRKK